MSPQSPHISWLFLYFYNKKRQQILIREKISLSTKNFYIVLVTYIYTFVKLRQLEQIYDSCSTSIYKFGLSVCLSALMLPWVIRTFSHPAPGYQDLSGYQDRLSGPSRSQQGYQDQKNGCQDLFFCVSAKNAKQTNTFVGFCEYVSISIRLYTEIECHI